MLYILVVFVFVLIILYRYLNSTYDYWQKRNVPYAPPVTFLGNLKDSIIMKKSLGEVYADIYNKYKDMPYVGIYKIRKPAILVRDPEIVKDILIKDFDDFEKNDFFLDEKVDPIGARNPFFQFGSKWRTSRSQLSFCFSSDRVKRMFPFMHTVAQNMLKYIDNEAKVGGNPIETKELASKFTSDNVATCAFGLDGKAFEDPNSEFTNVGRSVIERSILLNLKLLLIFLFPEWGKYLRVRFIPIDAVNYFRNIIKTTLKYREDHNVTRNDFLDAITQTSTPNEPQITVDEITAHTFSFFNDGYETSSITLSFLLYDLAANIEAQEKLRNEITEITKQHGGKLTYDTIQEMNYLDWALSESLRLHPPAMFLSKICTKKYKLPPCNKFAQEVAIEENMPVVISVYGMHHDPKYFADPEKFDPDRFSDGNKGNIIKGSYLPFGEGPRICVAITFAILQVKIAVATIIQNFDVRVHKKTKEPLVVDPYHILLLAKGGLWLDYFKRS